WHGLCGHFSAFALILAVMALVAGCAQAPLRSASHVAAAQPLATLDLPVDGANGKASALLIAAEFALQAGDAAKATADYAEAAQISNDPAIARRALQLALVTHDANAAQRMLQRSQALGASAHDLAMARGQLAMSRGDRATAEQQFRGVLASGKVEDWKTFAAS